MTDEVTELVPRLNPLPPETREEKREKLKARKSFGGFFGPFVRAMLDVMTSYHQARAQGVERADAAKGVEEVLRAHWPKPTTKFPARCGACDDTGWEEFICRQWARCERESCQRKGDDFQHRYVRLCECPAADKFRKRAVSVEDITATLGRTTKPKKGWRQIGG